MNSKCVQGGFRLLRGALVAVIVAAALAKGAFAGPLEDGVAAYSRGDFATALRLLRPLAENGNAYAQYSLGFMYATGKGVPRDYTVAVK